MSIELTHYRDLVKELQHEGLERYQAEDKAYTLLYGGRNV